MDICLICLRTDRSVRHGVGLSEFHDELCHFALLVSKAYCTECEYLLTKFYKFKQKCVKASKIYRDWLSGEIKDPIHDLHKLLPPSSFGIWKPDVERIRNIEIESADDYSTLEDLIKYEYVEEKPECDLTYYTESIKLDEVHEKSDDIDFKSDYNRTEEISEKLEEHIDTESYNLDFDIKYDTENEISEEPKISKKRKVSKNNMKALKKRKSSDKRQKETKDIVTSIKKNSPWRDLLRKNRLNEELVQRLSLFGDIVTEDGITIDKELIRKLVQHEGGVSVIKQIKRATCREDILNLSSVIQATLTTIDNDKTIEPDYGSVFDIEYLPTRDMKLAEFERRKTYECYIKAEHKCDICYQAFRGPLHLKSHQNKYHDVSSGGKFCPICNMKLVDHGKRNKHIERHYAVYRCKLCPLVTYQRNTMKEHFQKHQGKLYKCEPCNVTYKWKSKYYNHMSVYHRRGRIVCTVCGRGFPSTRSLQVHSAVAHREAPLNAEGTGVQCEECDVTFPSQGVYEAHIRDVHEPPPDLRDKTRPPRDNYSLPGYRTRPRPRPDSNDQLTRAPRAQKCRVCNVSRSGAGWLKAHFRREHPDLDMDALYADTKLHLCDICGVGTSSLQTLRDHMSIHTASVPHACDLCPKRFRTMLHLRNHRLSHFPPTLPCPHCGKKFKTKANLYNHERGHTGARIYKCHICTKGFISSATLNEHIRGVHYNVRRLKRGAKGTGAADTGAGGKVTDKTKRVGGKRGDKIASEMDEFSSVESE